MSRFHALRPHEAAARFWGLAGLVLLVAHDAVFLAQTGPGEVLARTLRSGMHGHWAVGSALLLASAAVGAAVTAYRLIVLRRRAKDVGAAPAAADGRAAPYARRVGITWVRLVAIVAIGFLVQENVEHLAAHGHLIGLGALFGPEYPLAVPVIVTLAGIAAAIAALVVATEHTLLARIRAAVAGRPRAPRLATRPPSSGRLARLSAMARPDAGRAPPAVFVTL